MSESYAFRGRAPYISGNFRSQTFCMIYRASPDLYLCQNFLPLTCSFQKSFRTLREVAFS